MLNNELVLGWCPNGTGTVFPFDAIYPQRKNVMMEGFADVDAVVFWGGADIHPSLYNSPRHPQSQAGYHPSARDIFEWKTMLYCKMHNIPMIGVCRGAQLMCAFAGGELVQDVTGHTGGIGHEMVTKEGEVMITTSCHHQMLYPFDVDHEMLAWTVNGLSKHYHFGERKDTGRMDDKVEPEVVYFPAIRGLAIQGHPEWANKDSRYVKYCLELVRSKLLTEEVENAAAA
jgi:gamma-glutamyl-gamma-aminobutyrate hydrolase PuuD